MRFALLAASVSLCAPAQQALLLDRESFRHYVDEFNSVPTPGVVSHIPDHRAWDWMKENTPFFTCPDPDIERTWYYRWWAFRKHIRRTPEGFILTEFLRPVGHADGPGVVALVDVQEVALYGPTRLLVPEVRDRGVAPVVEREDQDPGGHGQPKRPRTDRIRILASTTTMMMV